MNSSWPNSISINSFTVPLAQVGIALTMHNEEQLLWISRQLEKCLLKAEKAKLREFDKKESTSSVIRTSLNFIDKKKNENKYNKNNYQKRISS